MWVEFVGFSSFTGQEFLLFVDVHRTFFWSSPHLQSEAPDAAMTKREKQKRNALNF